MEMTDTSPHWCPAGDLQACADAAAERIAFLEEQVTSLGSEMEAAASQAEAALRAAQEDAAAQLAAAAADKEADLAEAAAQLAAAQVAPWCTSYRTCTRMPT